MTEKPIKTGPAFRSREMFDWEPMYNIKYGIGFVGYFFGASIFLLSIFACCVLATYFLVELYEVQYEFPIATAVVFVTAGMMLGWKVVYPMLPFNSTCDSWGRWMAQNEDDPNSPALKPESKPKGKKKSRGSSTIKIAC